MKAVIQRVQSASVKVNGETVGKCGKGFLVLLCVMQGDTEEDINVLSAKISKLRIFEDENGKINKSITDVSGEMLIISQFTLAADCRHGNRPDFLQAAPPHTANEYYEKFVQEIINCGIHAEKGVFGEHMDVSLINDGPFTVLLDTNDLKKKK